ncbi:CDP-glycerol glycerophosphotransferase family protein [uncultured Sphaerochaeta sp.]|uniref:CDP-glycerol glycerophosphotransferase family protein n=1 Tax=uncultured Sphaerochaeta sp. TaxID=886478 RepID=UPI002A0A1B7C|nr:CDP-glycerol glycerophosphotransferase family protein [uncultured Sphaerochaeta sp.]
MNNKIKLQLCLMRCLHALLPLDHRKVVFCSFSGGTYSDNPKAISERLHELYPSAKQVWLFNDPKEKQVMLPQYIQGVKRWSLRAIYELATSRVWVFNDTQPYWAYKGKNQVYIQTWHGDRGFKKILNDCRPRTKKDQLPETKTCDLAIAGSDFGESIFRSAFRYTGAILKTGTPRNDKLIDIDVETILQKKKELHLDASCKYLLYAPTLRSKASETKQDQAIQQIDLIEVLAFLEKSTGERWKVLVRAHNKVVGLSGIPESEKILNVSHYEDMADLLQVSDILISDYSSSVGDFALTSRPIILFQDDRESYLEHDRTFYFDLDTSPFWIAQSQNDLVSILCDLPNRDSKQNCQEILSFYKTHESGHACEDTCNFIIEKIH